MHPLCTLVHTNLGPTPLNQPANPSVLYMTFKPVNTEEVSSLIEPGRGVCVDGDDVEIERICCLRAEDVSGLAIVGKFCGDLCAVARAAAGLT